MPRHILDLNRHPHHPLEQILSYLVPTEGKINLSQLSLKTDNPGINRVLTQFPSISNAQVLRQVCILFHWHVDRLLHSRNTWVFEGPAHLREYMDVFLPNTRPDFQTVLLGADCVFDEELLLDRWERGPLITALCRSITPALFSTIQILAIRIPLELRFIKEDAEVMEAIREGPHNAPRSRIPVCLSRM